MNSPRVYCNPLDLDYRYQEIRVRDGKGERRSVHREAADPSMVQYRGRTYLFASMSAGFWHSTDLVTWEFQPTKKLPPFDYAPDVREVDGALCITVSRMSNAPFFRSVDPLADDFELVSPGSFPFWDPSVFQDDDGSVFLYWGCSSDTPLRGVQLDRSSFAPLAEPQDLLFSDTATRGWEVPGEDNIPPVGASDPEPSPFVEGAWMTKHRDRYYLQYAAPGTEVNTYADGYFTGPTPLGPFEYSEYSPFSSKPGGFITGAGHGSTFQDAHGNWWHAATMRISVNDIFERRVGLFPAGFDDDGVLFSNQNFGDYPRRVTDGQADPWAPPTWMLLSHGASVEASSQIDGHPASSVTNENARDWWVAQGTAPGEHVTVDLGEVKSVSAVQVNLADHEVALVAPRMDDERGIGLGNAWRGIYQEPGDVALSIHVDVSVDGENWDRVSGEGVDRPHQLVVLDEAATVRYVRLTAAKVPFDAQFAVSGVRVFGLGTGSAPMAVVPRVTRTGPRGALIEWNADGQADGWNVRYGLHPGKLYHSWHVLGRTRLALHALNAGHDYWVAVDAFNENGIAHGEPVKLEQS